MTGWLRGPKQRSAKPYNRGFESHPCLIYKSLQEGFEYPAIISSYNKPVLNFLESMLAHTSGYVGSLLIS